MIELELEALGLSQRESKVYLALLGLGSSTVGPISDMTKIATSKIYPTLQKLQDRGLVSYIIMSKTKYFQALSPKNILSTIKEKEELFNQLLPKLEALRVSEKVETSAQIYQGYASAKTLFDDILLSLNKDDYYYAFAYKDQYHGQGTAKTFLKHFHSGLKDKKVKDKLIVHVSVKDDVIENFSGNKNIKMHFTALEIPLGLIITSKFIVISTWGKEPLNIRINSKTVAKDYTKFFESIWGTNL